MKGFLCGFIIFSTFIFSGCNSKLEENKIIGSWKRVKPNEGWVIYSYQHDGQLLRATESKPLISTFGEYEIDEDIIIFKNNPENYAPVKFKIGNSTCSGVVGETLFLYDKQSGEAYGCYFMYKNN